MPFGAAVAAIDGAAGLDQFTLEKMRSPKIRELMNKVVLVKDPRIEATFPQEWPAHVAIELEDDQRFEKFIRYPKGDPENPLSWDELAAKFQVLTGRKELVAAIAQSNPAAIPILCA